MSLKKGQKLDSGFSVIDVVDLAEMQATGIWAKHDKCGAEVFHVLNDDSENLFAFAFATASEDNTGVAHILEHSVLCGSENYPLKDAFLILAQGSLQTFLNAMTYPDKTVYPASSVNEHDYFNLMSVYGDAVFRPLLSEWSFMQEGHRYEFVKAGDADSGTDRLSITGVVYNEMKGAYSSLDRHAYRWSIKAVLPDTPYDLESGGSPEHIPELTWEGLKDFHRRRYSPANCRIFLAGNIPTEKQLDFINTRFFSSIEEGTVAPGIVRQERWTSPKEYKVPCPASGDTKSTVFLSWLCSDITDITETAMLAALEGTLLGHDGSPLMKVLIESDLGEDVSPVTGLDVELAETVVTVGLRGVADGAEKQVEALIMDELRRLVADGIPRQEIEAALLSIEFSQREIRRSGGPFSLVWMARTLRSWMHGCKPWESLLRNPHVEELKRRLAEDGPYGGRYLESLIQKYLLDNPHRALVVVEPKDDFLSRQEAGLAEKLAGTMLGLSAEERQGIIDKSAGLEKIQSESNSPEALATIPHLSRSDLCPEPEPVSRIHENLGGIPALCHDLHTNGISYVDFAFPVDLLPRDDYLWLPFFGRAAISVGLPGMDYAEVSTLLARTVGGFNFNLETGSAAPAEDGGSMLETAAGTFDLAGRDWMIYHLKCLDEKAEASLDLVLRLVNEADFSDHKRIRDLVLEMKNQTSSSIAPYGSWYASSRAGRLASASQQTGEAWAGISQLLFAHRLAKMDTAEIVAKLECLRKAVVSGGVIANLSGSAGALRSNGSAVAARFGRFGPPKPRPDLPGGTGFANAGAAGEVREVFASPSLQVGFAAMALKAAPFDTGMQTAETVLSHYLSTGALWEDIRMKGGAYGASASSDSLERCFTFSTYRDPSPLRSLDSFSTILKSRAADLIAESDLVKTIIGCYARETTPRTPAGKSKGDFLRFLYRIGDGYLSRKLERLVGISTGDISAALGELAAQKPFGKVVVTGMKDAEHVAKSLGTEIQELPV
ncbi:MAG: insulinase family protein [Treponema sp.]|nr:insulinase family protein [Treponema sp.]